MQLLSLSTAIRSLWNCLKSVKSFWQWLEKLFNPSLATTGYFNTSGILKTFICLEVKNICIFTAVISLIGRGFQCPKIKLKMPQKKCNYDLKNSINDVKNTVATKASITTRVLAEFTLMIEREHHIKRDKGQMYHGR